MSGTIWVRTDPSPDGSTYIASVEFDEDRSRALAPSEAPHYAAAVLAAAAHAEYDAAVLAQLRRLPGITDATAGALLMDLRADRPPLDQSAIAPLALVPGVNASGTPFLTVLIEEQRLGQWTVEDARGHALNVLEVASAADLDSGYYRLMRGVVGLPEDRARAVVAKLADHRSPRH